MNNQLSVLRCDDGNDDVTDGVSSDAFTSTAGACCQPSVAGPWSLVHEPGVLGKVVGT